MSRVTIDGEEHIRCDSETCGRTEWVDLISRPWIEATFHTMNEHGGGPITELVVVDAEPREKVIVLAGCSLSCWNKAMTSFRESELQGYLKARPR